MGTSRSGVKVPAGVRPTVTPFAEMSLMNGSGRKMPLVSCGSNFAVFEFVFVLSDSGYAEVLLVPERPDTDETLLGLCRRYATPVAVGMAEEGRHV